MLLFFSCQELVNNDQQRALTSRTPPRESSRSPTRAVSWVNRLFCSETDCTQVYSSWLRTLVSSYRAVTLGETNRNRWRTRIRLDLAWSSAGRVTTRCAEFRPVPHPAPGQVNRELPRHARRHPLLRPRHPEAHPLHRARAPHPKPSQRLPPRRQPCRARPTPRSASQVLLRRLLPPAWSRWGASVS